MLLSVLPAVQEEVVQMAMRQVEQEDVLPSVLLAVQEEAVQTVEKTLCCWCSVSAASELFTRKTTSSPSCRFFTRIDEPETRKQGVWAQRNFIFYCTTCTVDPPERV